LNQQLSKLPQGTVFSFSPPAIPGVGSSGGFQFVLEDRAGRDVHFLAGNLDKFMAATRKRPEIGTISTTFLPSVPQQFVHVDREKVLKQGVALNDVYQTIQAFMAGCSSTTSMISAALGKYTCKRKRLTGQIWRRSGNSMYAT